MSYCRWSCEDYQCDLYCYEDVTGGWTTHVAASRYVFKEPLPPAEPLTEDNCERWLARSQRVSEMCEVADTVPIGLPCDGKSFNDDTLEGFRDRVLSLLAMGYRAPGYLLTKLDEEIKANAEHEPRAVASRAPCSCSASGYDPECKWEGHHHA